MARGDDDGNDEGMMVCVCERRNRFRLVSSSSRCSCWSLPNTSGVCFVWFRLEMLIEHSMELQTSSLKAQGTNWQRMGL